MLNGVCAVCAECDTDTSIGSMQRTSYIKRIFTHSFSRAVEPIRGNKTAKMWLSALGQFAIYGFIAFRLLREFDDAFEVELRLIAAAVAGALIVFTVRFL